jgi:hypothetical protein
MRQTWIPFPIAWFSNVEFMTLKPTTKNILIQLWYRASQNGSGNVPKCPKKAQVMSGLPVKPVRVAEALKELLKAGLIEDHKEVFFLAHYGQIFRQNSAKKAQKRKKISHRPPKKSTGSAPPSRAGDIYPSDIYKENENGTPSPEGRPSISKEENIQKTRSILAEVLK